MTTTEKEFVAVATAAAKFLEMGRTETAYCLDDLARKMNRDLTYRKNGHKLLSGMPRTPIHIESPLEAAGLRPIST